MELRLCPTHGSKLWPKAKLRKIRFHDLRHTTASLLMMAGANPAAVQRILRDSDPRITTEVYGHLAPNYLRDEINRLRFGITDEGTSADAHVPLVSQGAEDGFSTRRALQNPPQNQLLQKCALEDSNL